MNMPDPSRTMNGAKRRSEFDHPMDGERWSGGKKNPYGFLTPDGSSVQVSEAILRSRKVSKFDTSEFRNVKRSVWSDPLPLAKSPNECTMGLIADILDLSNVPKNEFILATPMEIGMAKRRYLAPEVQTNTCAGTQITSSVPILQEHGTSIDDGNPSEHSFVASLPEDDFNVEIAVTRELPLINANAVSSRSSGGMDAQSHEFEEDEEELESIMEHSSRRAAPAASTRLPAFRLKPRQTSNTTAVQDLFFRM